MFADTLIDIMDYDMPEMDVRSISDELRDLYKRKESGNVHSDAFKTMEEIANENGFKCEKYQVVTEDGYILGIWRIPGALSESLEEMNGKPPVLLQHGLESDMMQWVYNTPETAPALVLARGGYDVWLGNNRGNRWSEKHTTLSSKDKAFWDFDWEDMGTKDTPAVIDFILGKTGFSKINYIGHSEGTTQIMAGASLIPDYYKAKMNVCVMLAPPAAMKNNSVAIFNLLSLPINRAIIVSMLDTIHMWNVLPYGYLNTGVAVLFCNLFNGKLCDIMMSLVADEDPTIDNTDRYDVYMSTQV
jgi:pimeloyl-ACP methyl ester carboxylesterase